jgi:hypothetical protein
MYVFEVAFSVEIATPVKTSIRSITDCSFQQLSHLHTADAVKVLTDFMMFFSAQVLDDLYCN